MKHEVNLAQVVLSCWRKPVSIGAVGMGAGLRRNGGFSLVEISLVLAVLGLVTGGIIAGQHLIRGAQLRSVISEYNAYKLAVNTFKDEYHGLPGDLYNAEDFWGTMSSGACPHATGGTGTQTCNGDNDGELRPLAGAAGQSNERFTFWQHLANAGLIEGSYSGLAGSGGPTHHIGGENAPSSKVPQGVWAAHFVGDQSGSTGFFDGEYGNIWWLGAPAANAAPNTGLFTPKEAWGIDSKIDDGMPATGLVTLRTRNLCTNATNAVADSDNLDAVYNLSNTDEDCVPLFRRVIESE